MKEFTPLSLLGSHFSREGDAKPHPRTSANPPNHRGHLINVAW
jgi:hypothetical protein